MPKTTGTERPIAEQAVFTLGGQQIVPVRIPATMTRAGEKRTFDELGAMVMGKIIDEQSAGRRPYVQTEGAGGDAYKAYLFVQGTLAQRRTGFVAMTVPKIQPIEVQEGEEVGRDGKMRPKWVQKIDDRTNEPATAKTYWHGMIIVPIENAAEAGVLLSEVAEAYEPRAWRQKDRNTNKASPPTGTYTGGPAVTPPAIKKAAKALAQAAEPEDPEEH